MKSSRGKTLKLQVCEEPHTVTRLDNHICISDTYISNIFNSVVKLKKTNLSRLFGQGDGSIIYPVMFTSDIKPGQIYIPPEIRRDLSLKLDQKIDCALDEIRDNEWSDISKITFVIQNIRNGTLGGKTVEAQDLAEAVRGSFELLGNQFPFQNGQIIVVPFRGAKLEMRVEGLELDALTVKQNALNYANLRESTQIRFINERSQLFKLNGEFANGEYDSGQMAEIPIDFVAKGIGGFKKEIAQLVRSVFYTRGTKQSLLDMYGVKKHPKGILLYGPPGTGKTLIAKSISELFTKKAVKIIQGPELKNSYYGATQQNLGDLFVEAKSNPRDLYVFIFDEIDALFAPRGSDGSVSTSNNNDLVSRFLSILDGPESLDNIIVIATTNRKELIDPAVLRAGRLETHIYIGLPDENERLEILQVHTKDMVRVLAQDVDLPTIARLTKNYSGAELARLVGVARSYAMGKNFDTKDGRLVLRHDIKSVDQAEKINQQYFIRALNEVKPMFGVDDFVQNIKPDNFISYNQNLIAIQENFQRCVDTLRFTKNMQRMNYLISGQAGTGKTSLALHLALQSHFSHIQVLSADKLLPHSMQKQLEIIDEIFARASQSSEPSVIILDNLENLIEATPDHQQYNNKLRLKFNEMLKYSASVDNKILVIATTESSNFLKKIGLAAHFVESENLEPVHLDFQDANKVFEVISGIAGSLGIKVSADLSGVGAQSSVDIPIKDLIYQLRKCAANTYEQLKLSDVMRLIMDQCDGDKCVGISVVPDEPAIASVGFFKNNAACAHPISSPALANIFSKNLT